MGPRYDEIGIDYARLRRPDPRIATEIVRLLGAGRSLLNVGAGTGNYEPEGWEVTAVEPSAEMTRQRRRPAARVLQASAECLPFDDSTFDTAMSIFTIHHWPEKRAGLREMRRVTRGSIVLLTFDPSSRPWLTDYIPELIEVDCATMPAMELYEEWLGRVTIEPLLVPHDCTDGFLHAYWCRPEAYLDRRIRSGSSAFWSIDAERGIVRLAEDLQSGAWHDRYGHLLKHQSYDAGYRFVVAKRQ